MKGARDWCYNAQQRVLIAFYRKSDQEQQLVLGYQKCSANTPFQKDMEQFWFWAFYGLSAWPFTVNKRQKKGTMSTASLLVLLYLP